MSKTKTQPRRVQGFESLREVGDDFAEQVDFKSSWDEVWSEVFGVKKKSSDHASSQPDFTVTDPVTGEQSIFDIKAHQSQKSSESKKSEQGPVRKDAAINHHEDFARSSERASKQETREIHQRLQDIMAELQKLVSSSKVLTMEFADVSVQQAPKQAGEYHLNFFDWLLWTIRKARENVENSGAWLATNKKKGGKGNWNNKQRKDWFANTSVSMGNESGGGYINQTG